MSLKPLPTQSLLDLIDLFEQSGQPVPLLDGVRRVGQDHIELAQAVAFDVLGFGQGVAPDDFEVLHAVQEQVHAGDG